MARMTKEKANVIVELLGDEHTRARIDRARKTIALAFDDPKAYAVKHRSALDERGLEKVDRWVALVDALEAAGMLASIDWKTDAAELDRVVARLLGKKLRWPKGADHDERTTAELLEIYGERLLREHGIALAHLDIGADEYELVLVPEANAKRLKALGPIEVFTGRDLPKLERARLAKEKKATAKEARDPDRQRQYVHSSGRVFVVWGKRWQADGQHYHAWSSFETSLGKDWTRAPVTKSDVEPAIPPGFVEVTREEWVRQSEQAKKARLAGKALRREVVITGDADQVRGRS